MITLATSQWCPLSIEFKYIHISYVNYGTYNFLTNHSVNAVNE